jgi:citrate lyase subunit beta/citryl-CoA lyase
MIEKALGTEADVLLFDMEDAVPPGEKGAARQNLSDTLRQLGSRPAAPGRHQLIFVRVNVEGQTEEDLEAVVRPGLDGLVVPKAEGAGSLLAIEQPVSRLERERGIETPVRFLPIVESARGLLHAAEIAGASHRVLAVMFGGEDFSSDLGLPPIREKEASELIYARSAIVVAAASARVRAIDTIWPAVNDPAAFLRETELARRLGFSGKGLIHPNQIDIANRVFSPSPDEIEYAQRVVAVAEEAEREGSGAVALDGKFVDRPIVERARHTLAVARAIGMVSPGS